LQALWSCVPTAEDNLPRIEVARALAVYAALLAVGCAVGFFLRPGKARRWAVGFCAAGALALLLTQVVIGFPLENAVTTAIGRSLAEAAAKEELNPLERGPDVAGAAAAAILFDVRYTVWFWLALAATALGPALHAAEVYLVRSQPHAVSPAPS
jgi:hypothetical protein